MFVLSHGAFHGIPWTSMKHSTNNVVLMLYCCMMVLTHVNDNHRQAARGVSDGSTRGIG